MRDCIKKAKDGVYLSIHAVPGSKKTSFSYDEFAKALRVKICAPALDGKANKELLSILNGFFGDVELHSGQKSRDKLVLVKGKSQDDVAAILDKLVTD